MKIASTKTLIGYWNWIIELNNIRECVSNALKSGNYPILQGFKYKDENKNILYEGNINHTKCFPNQVTCRIIWNDLNINVFIFYSTIKITGCKEESHAIYITKFIYKLIRRKIKLLPNETIPKVILTSWLTNNRFCFDFNVNREKLTELFNQQCFKDQVYNCIFRKNSVNVKFYPPMCKSEYSRISFQIQDNKLITTIDKVHDNPYKNDKKDKYVTFMVFYTSKTTVTGKTLEEINMASKLFKSIILNHKHFIAEESEHEDDLYLIKKDLLSLIKTTEI